VHKSTKNDAVCVELRTRKVGLLTAFITKVITAIWLTTTRPVGTRLHWYIDSRPVWASIVVRFAVMQVYGLRGTKRDKQCFIFIYFIYIYKLIYLAPCGCNFRGAVSSQRWPKPFPVLIAPLLRRDGQAEWAWVAWINNPDGRPVKGRHQSQ